MEKGFPCKWKSKLEYQYSHQIKYFKIKTVIRDIEGHHIITKRINPRKIYNNYKYICTQSRSTSIYNAKANSHNTTTVTPVTSMDWSSRQKIIKETQALNDTLDLMNLTDIHRTFHSKAAEYTFFSSAHGTFSRIEHI